MNNIVIRNIEPQEIRISGGGEVLGIQKVYVNGIDVTVGSAAYVIVPTKTSELINDSGFITNESDPTVPSYVKAISLADINNWNNKQNQLVSGTNIKTINGDSLLGAGNLTIDTTYSAGTGIEITEENVINNTITSYDDLTDLPTIPDKTSELLNDSGYVVDTELAEVAFNGSYLALSNTPTIPDSTSQLVNDSGYIDMDLLWSLFPKSTGSGSSINLNDTVKNAPLYLTLGATALSQDGTPTPSSPQDIHTISGSNTIKVEGQQLFQNTYITIPDDAGISAILKAGTYTLATCDSNNFGYNIYIKLYDNNGTIITSGGHLTATGASMSFSTSSYNYYGGAGTSSFSFTIDNDYKLGIGLLNTDGTRQVMLVKGNTVVRTYEPYTSQEADIDLDTIEYCKIGNYEDRIFKNVSGDTDYSNTREDGAWYIKKNIGKVVLDGTQGTISTPSTNRFNIDNAFNDYLKSGNNTTYLCDKYQAFDQKGSNGDFNTLVSSVSYGMDLSSSDTSYTIRFKDTRYTTTTDFQNSLASDNVSIYYILSTPIYTQITGTLAEQLETIYKNLTAESEQTNILQVNADLPFTISATTLKSLTNL